MESLSRLVDEILEKSKGLEKAGKRKQLKIKNEIAHLINEWHNYTR